MEAPAEIWAYLKENEGSTTLIGNLPLDYKAAVWRLQVAYKVSGYDTESGREYEDWLESVSGKKLYVPEIGTETASLDEGS
jgi:hypothetical protein